MKKQKSITLLFCYFIINFFSCINNPKNDYSYNNINTSIIEERFQIHLFSSKELFLNKKVIAFIDEYISYFEKKSTYNNKYGIIFQNLNFDRHLITMHLIQPNEKIEQNSYLGYVLYKNKKILIGNCFKSIIDSNYKEKYTYKDGCLSFWQLVLRKNIEIIHKRITINKDTIIDNKSIYTGWKNQIVGIPQDSDILLMDGNRKINYNVKTEVEPQIHLVLPHKLILNKVIVDFIKEFVDYTKTEFGKEFNYELRIESLIGDKSLISMVLIPKIEKIELKNYVGYISYKNKNIFINICLGSILVNYNNEIEKYKDNFYTWQMTFMNSKGEIFKNCNLKTIMFNMKIIEQKVKF